MTSFRVYASEKKECTHRENVASLIVLADFTLLLQLYKSLVGFHHTIRHIASADSCKMATGALYLASSARRSCDTSMSLPLVSATK